MPLPRRELSSVEVEAVCAAYSLGDPVSSDLVYEGTSSLYRTVCTSARGSRAVAVKIQDGGKSVSATKSFEALVLSAIRPAFPSVPVLLRPGVARLPMRTQEWGLTGRRFAVSVYEWVEVARPWQWTPEQRRGTVVALCRLQRGLNAMRDPTSCVRRSPSRRFWTFVSRGSSGSSGPPSRVAGRPMRRQGSINRSWVISTTDSTSYDGLLSAIGVSSRGPRRD